MSHRTRGFVVVLSAALWLTASSASSEIYRYRDAEGEIHAVSDIDMVPPEYREAAVADARNRSGGSLNIVETEAVPAPAPAGSPAAAAPSQPTQSEDWWRSRAIEKRRAVEDAKAALDSSEEAEQDDITSDTLHPVHTAGKQGGAHRPGRRGSVYYDDDDDEPSIEDLQASLDRAERDLSDFSERARKAGVPPGWLR